MILQGINSVRLVFDSVNKLQETNLLSNRFIIIFMALSLLLQACATTRVETTLVPGKEISSTLLGTREIDNRIVLEEITPLSVRLFRRVSKADYYRSEHQAVKEIRHETTTYNCSSTAYREYLSIMAVTLVVPLAYEFVTGFEIFHDLCDKNQPSYVIETAATDKTLSRETYAKDRIISSEIPLAGEPVTAQLDGNIYRATTSAAGIATFSKTDIAPLLNPETVAEITYQYNDSTLTTRLRGQDQIYTAGTSDPSAWPQLSWESSADSESTQAAADTAATVQLPTDPFPGGEGFIWALLPLQVEGLEGDGVMWLNRGNLAANISPAFDPKLPGRTDSTAMQGEEIAAKSAAADGNLASVTIGTGNADSSAAGEWKITLKIKFDTNKATIRKEYYSRLKEIGEALKKNPQLTGIIEGHTDNVGSSELNQKISVRRAEAVAQHLSKTFAISSERLKVAGYGMSRPIAANSTPKGRAKNRRIEAKFRE